MGYCQGCRRTTYTEDEIKKAFTQAFHKQGDIHFAKPNAAFLKEMTEIYGKEAPQKVEEFCTMITEFFLDLLMGRLRAVDMERMTESGTACAFCGSPDDDDMIRG